MEQFKCMECSNEFGYRKTLGRHIRDVHQMDWPTYLAKHGRSETRTCHCGKTFENTRYPGGPRAHGRAQKYCSPQCNQIAVNCRTRGIAVEQYWEAQKMGCSICGSTISLGGLRRLALDHDHVTGKFRGGLCSNCNTALGMFKDDPELLRKAIDYLGG